MYRETFTVEQLSYHTGVSARRIRKWISIGLVPRAKRAGRYGGYTHEHIRRVREVMGLVEQNRTLEDMRDYFNPYTGDDDDA